MYIFFKTKELELKKYYNYKTNWIMSASAKVQIGLCTQCCWNTGCETQDRLVDEDIDWFSGNKIYTVKIAAYPGETGSTWA